MGYHTYSWDREMDFRRPLTVITTSLDGDVLAVLAGAEDEFSGRRLHRVLGRGSEHGVRKAVERLVEEGIVQRRQAGQAKLYRLNRDHLAAPCVEDLSSLRAQLIARLREAAAGWNPRPHSSFLFGSVARGEASPGSDLDLLVIRAEGTPEEEPAWRDQLAALERDATSWTGNDARILEYGESELLDAAVRPLILQVLAEGIELYGSRHGLRRSIGRGT